MALDFCGLLFGVLFRCSKIDSLPAQRAAGHPLLGRLQPQMERCGRSGPRGDHLGTGECLRSARGGLQPIPRQGPPGVRRRPTLVGPGDWWASRIYAKRPPLGALLPGVRAHLVDDVGHGPVPAWPTSVDRVAVEALVRRGRGIELLDDPCGSILWHRWTHLHRPRCAAGPSR